MDISAFEVRLKSNNKFLSHHFFARTPEQAAQKARKKGRVLSVRKVHPEDIIGKLEHLVERTEERGYEQDVVFNGTTLESIVFPKVYRTKRKLIRNQKRRFSNEQERGEETA